MSAQAAPFAVLTNIALRSRQLSAGLPEQEKAAEQWNGIGFVLAGEHYVAPMGEVTEILHVPRFTQIPGVRSFLMGAANVRGRLLPLVDLDAFFELPRAATRTLRQRRVLVVEKDDLFSGLVVDSVLGMQYFGAENFTSDTSGVPERIQPFVAGGYTRNGETWNVFSATELLGDERFLDVAQR
ncbi:MULTISPECIES: chemotaxis protein CheW [unclassified Marinobacter]|jgi:twitching motility protein PilI|uniref:chemotaxis protein CheW n=1 Tax=unclassified Marinobacter TaxID=83889 RepID=UPI00200E906E|nr:MULTISPECIES: chemotaxis protein CheW [unclassified Marinobacter]MCL1477723.1 chemotaxis protein CheW [Marinobacter sp.]MCL1482226.1 chemotaxis protein CheW [Marinobacter sp.]MCL1485769.1 chemotaxis protein CheW [Marinobacter sp.]MCL1489007.1 chemotaxis protein CheW [Marinobacter sp.]UQG55795.1 chemotaxis protein CheW [Marinobacter sp. M4C]